MYDYYFRKTRVVLKTRTMTKSRKVSHPTTTSADDEPYIHLTHPCFPGLQEICCNFASLGPNNFRINMPTR